MALNRHKRFMMRAIELARKAEGKTWPNPLVGAVIVKKGKVVGEGYHEKAGAPHAEVIALKRARKSARDADLYVNLEPCSHYGRTPPCVDSVIKSNIKQIYVAMKDPNPLVSGRGLDLLRRKGIDVRMGICRKEAEELNKHYIKLMKPQLTEAPSLRSG